MKKFFLLLSLTILAYSCQKTQQKAAKPKLVVGIVVDQMRYDYLTRFYNKFGEGGFKKLLNKGFSLENAHYNYIPTYTAVGHASIYTGTTPDNHGIIGNWWYDKFKRKSIYCVDDKSFSSVGTETNKGKKSPYRMLTTTVTDQLRLAQNMNGKTIGIAIKDRSSILPAGHSANAAYWFDGGKEGKWISSSYYLNELPNWVKEFNSKDLASDYLSKKWETLYDINTYTESIEDDNNFEAKFNGLEKSVFPYDLPNLMIKNEGRGLIKSTPFGNTFTVDFAKSAIIGEKLGKGNYTDFLAVSFSSTDYIGHQFGVSSKEIQDTYLRLDKDLEDFILFLDKEVGKGNYTLFLTADHAVTHVPSYLKSVKIPANYYHRDSLSSFINNITLKYFKSDDLVENISNFQVFLNKEKINSLKLNTNDVADKIAQEVVNFSIIQKAVTAKTLQNTSFSSGILNSLQNGYNQKISGDVMLVPSPSTLSNYYSKGGTNHGSGYSYDTHVPVIFYGAGIQEGSSKKKYEIIDIAPTISNLLQIEFPNGNTGKIIEEVLK